MTTARLPAHLEIAALRRAAESRGGFATVIAKGERDAGVILILTIEKGGNTRLWERMPALDGSRDYAISISEDTEKTGKIAEYITRRTARDPDIWVIELDIAEPERFIAEVAR